jgi:hypothetical protein
MLSSTETNPLLAEPINNLRFTQEFKVLSAKMGLRSLQDIIIAKEKAILDEPSFTHEWLRELVVFMSAQGLTDLLEADERF